jgi:hypothetical protein
MVAYLTALMWAFDHLLNVALGGSVHESISSHAYRLEQSNDKYFKHLAKCINCMFWWQNNHCRGAHNRERPLLIFLKIVDNIETKARP